MDNRGMADARTTRAPERSLADILRRLRQRALWIGGLSGGVWGLFSVVLALIVGVWLDLVLQLSPVLRIAVLLSAAGAGIIVFSRRALRGAAQGAREWLARRLDEVSLSGGQIASGCDLALTSGAYAYSSRPALTSGLAQLAIRRATELAGQVPHAAALPARPLGRSIAALAAIAGVCAVLVTFMPKLAATEYRRFTDPFGDHPPFSPMTFVVEPGNAQVTYGAGLDIHARVEGPPVDGLELVLVPLAPRDSTSTAEQATEEAVLMFPDEPGEWRASISNVTRPTAYFVRARNARSSRYRIEVITVPQIAEVLVRIVHPAYTRLPAYDGPVPTAGISGLRNSEVTVSARSNRPLSGGSVTCVVREERHEFPLKPLATGSDTVSGTFPITAGGRIELRVVDVAGQSSTEEWSAPVTELTDEHPFVRLIEPRPVSFATPTAVIPVVVSAEDDYGVARVELFRNLNDSRYLPDSLPVAQPPPRHVYQMARLPLELYGLEPGDEIKLFARVEDNEPRVAAAEGTTAISGKGAEGAIVLIRIISEAQFEQMQQAREGMETLLAKYQEARRRMESLGDEIERLRKELKDQSADAAASEETRQALKDLAQRLADEAEALRKLSERKHPFAVDQVLNREIERMRDSLQRLQKQTESLAGQPRLTPEEIEQALEQLADELREEREHLDQEAMEPLETLAALARLAQDESDFVQLYRRQRDLADRLESLKGKDQGDNPSLKARMRDLEEEQRRIRLDLDQMLSDIEEHAAQLPDDESLAELRRSAEEFVAAVRESGAAEAMTEAETGLAEFSGTRGHKGAREAADLLEKLLAKGEEVGPDGAGAGAGRRRFQPNLAEAMRQTLQQMLGTGAGGGQGSGPGGSSARRNNVGLYGGSASSDAATGMRDGQSARHILNRGTRGDPGTRTLSDDDQAHDAEAALRAGGANAAAVPLRYRRQVGRYFQTIADELGDK